MASALPSLCELRLGLGACTNGLKKLDDNDLAGTPIDVVTLERFKKGEEVWQFPACGHLLGIRSASRLILECYKSSTVVGNRNDWTWSATPFCPICRTPYMDLDDIRQLLDHPDSRFQPPREDMGKGVFPYTPPPPPPVRIEPTSPPSWVLNYDPEEERMWQQRLENPFSDNDGDNRPGMPVRRQRAARAEAPLDASGVQISARGGVLPHRDTRASGVRGAELVAEPR